MSTFNEMLAEMARIDDAMSDPNINLPDLIGDMKDKVDALNSVLTRMECTAQFLDEMAKPLLAKARALRANHARLEAYIVNSMETHNADTIPGVAYKLALVKSSNPEVRVADATPGDYTAYPDFVQIRREYKWDKIKIKTFLKESAEVPVDFPATLVYNYRPVFKANVPESLEKKKGKK